MVLFLKFMLLLSNIVLQFFKPKQIHLGREILGIHPKYLRNFIFRTDYNTLLFTQNVCGKIKLKKLMLFFPFPHTFRVQEKNCNWIEKNKSL